MGNYALKGPYTLLGSNDFSQLELSVLFFSFSLNLLGWRCLTKLYGFQVHSSTAHHVYTVLCVHRPMSSLLPSPFIPLYPPPPPPTPSPRWLSPQCRRLSMMAFFLFFAQSFHHPASQLPSSNSRQPCIYESVSIYLLVQFVHLSPHMSEIIWQYLEINLIRSLLKI